MNPHFTYALVLLSTVSICFIFSFHPKIRFNLFFSNFFKASSLVAIPFIIWDIWFTHDGVWWFNNQYTLQINFVNLPIEECLFFIFIPFSCVFTYYCLKKFIPSISEIRNIAWLTYLLTLISLTTAILFKNKIYTLTSMGGVAVSLVILQNMLKVSWITRSIIIYMALMAGFLPVNGILTGMGLLSPVVNYNTEQIINIRVFTIPLEDFFYGYILIVWNFYFFEKWVSENKNPSFYQTPN